MLQEVYTLLGCGVAIIPSISVTNTLTLEVDATLSRARVVEGLTCPGNVVCKSVPEAVGRAPRCVLQVNKHKPYTLQLYVLSTHHYSVHW